MVVNPTYNSVAVKQVEISASVTVSGGDEQQLIVVRLSATVTSVTSRTTAAPTPCSLLSITFHGFRLPRIKLLPKFLVISVAVLLRSQSNPDGKWTFVTNHHHVISHSPPTW